MSLSEEETLTATSGSNFMSESKHSSEIKTNDSDFNRQPPLARPAKKVKTSSSIQWTAQVNFPHRHGFQGTAGIQVQELDKNSTPLKIFEQFFTPELTLHIANETNRYVPEHLKSQSVASPSHMQSWFDTTPAKMSLFLSMTIVMLKPHLRDLILETPFFPNTMLRDRFMDSLSYLHFVDNSHADTTDRLYKLHLVVDKLAKKFKRGDVVHCFSNKGLNSLVWRDKKDIRMLSTMHTEEMADTSKRNPDGIALEKPKCVLDYNKGIKGVDIADRLASSNRSVRKSTK